MLTGYRFWAVLWSAVWLGAGPLFAAPASQPATAPAADELPAADSLYLSAVRLLANPSAPARAARLVTLVEFAHTLAPTDARVARMLGDLRLTSGAWGEAAKAFQAALNQRREDHALQLQVLALHLRRLQTADQRLELLAGVIDDASLPGPLRAEAAVAAGTIELNRGQGAKSRAMLRRALELDPRHPVARAELMAATAPASAPATAPAARLALSLTPVRPSVSVGQPVAVEVVLANSGEVDVPLSTGGTPAPVVRFQAVLSGADTARKTAQPFADLPAVTLPAPAYLLRGQSVRATVDLDAGSLHAYLAARSLERIALSITGELAGVKSQAVEIVRLPLAEAGAVDSAMLDIVRAIKRGGIDEKMQAARQVAAMLKLHERAAAGEAKLPAGLPPNAQKPMLLSMMRALLGDAVAAVRAEMIAALQDLARLDATMIELLTLAWRDSSSLVRLRVLELYLTHRPGDWRKQAAAMQEDADARLRLLVRAAM